MNSYLIMDDKKTIENFSTYSTFVNEQKKKIVNNVVNEEENNVKNTIRNYVKLLFSKNIINMINKHIEPQHRPIAWFFIILILIIFIYQIISRSINLIFTTIFSLIYYIFYYVLYAIPFWFIRLIINIFRFILGFKKKTNT